MTMFMMMLNKNIPKNFSSNQQGVAVHGLILFLDHRRLNSFATASTISWPVVGTIQEKLAGYPLVIESL